ncbi:protein retinal degeneration B isoform X2 [Planococcus citri]|uniref:protein retinal degeneration B isoform X2 n=1 Tax=Planococcus citri TaxID=170843 RepID=UPI0031F7F530
MLIKEYRIPLPLSVEEYKIAQLYMIAKISRDETKDAGSGVQILINEPYENGPEGTNGQYTKKIYYVREYLPGWIKSLLPKSSLNVEEEAWNAYPYTKTRYTSPFIEKFFIEIDTVYRGDYGDQYNVFNLSGNDLRNRVIDVIDVVKDTVENIAEEDPTIYVSEKTGRGPLTVNWLEEYSQESKDAYSRTKKDIMCAYKLCKVDFRYWGMQAKLEKFIHDFALRKTMLKAHRRAWLWQDEWYGLTMDDIREIERQTQEILRNKMAAIMGPMPNEAGQEDKSNTQQQEQNQTQQQRATDNLNTSSLAVSLSSIGKSDKAATTATTSKIHSSNVQTAATEWKIGSLARDSDSEHSDEDDDEFFDCQDAPGEVGPGGMLVKWSSLDLLTEEDAESVPLSSFSDKGEGSVYSGCSALKRTSSERARTVTNISCPGSPTLSVMSVVEGDHHTPASGPSATDSPSSCKITTLLLVVHAGSILEASTDVTAKKSDITTLRGSFESVMRQHYPTMVGRVAIKLVACPPITTNSLSILSSLSPYSFDVSPSSTDAPHFTHDSIPMGVIPVLSTISTNYIDALNKMIHNANNVYRHFLKTEEGFGFNGNICLIGDCMGAILAYDALCHSKRDREDFFTLFFRGNRNVTESSSTSESADGRRSSSTGDDSSNEGLRHISINKLEFDVRDLFMFGSPVPLVLAFRKMSAESLKLKLDSESTLSMIKPSVQQVYNLFHPSDPVASRLEPLLSNRFSMLPPVNIPRYQKYPLGNGLPYHLLEVIQANAQLFSEVNASTVTSVGTTVNNSIQMRRMSEASLFSNSSGLLQEPLPIQVISELSQKWWGNKRLDYALYCPEGLSNFPTNALPHLFHASYWESFDVVAFILRQIGGFDLMPSGGLGEEQDTSGFVPSQPREKWTRKRTSMKLGKLKNIGANHRANDVIVKEGAPQTLTARFMYGSYDVITLTGEKVDIHVMNDGGGVGDWIYLSTQVTDKTGRVTYTIPSDKSFSYGIHHVKMVVRGDHTSVDFRLAVVPPKTESVVFSIDGSFTASVSVTGRDPKVRAGAVDVVRQWQELGYLILYISARPDMQQQMVLSWLAQHNFPYGLVAFADRFSADPLGYKTSYLKNLTQEHGLAICAAYGSNKDIAVYSAVGLKPSQIFIVGRVSKKYQNQATMLSDGYAAHLSNLLTHGGPRPAQGNARMVLFPRGCFGHNSSIRRRRSAKRTTSFPLSSGPANASSSGCSGTDRTAHQKF